MEKKKVMTFILIVLIFLVCFLFGIYFFMFMGSNSFSDDIVDQSDYSAINDGWVCKYNDKSMEVSIPEYLDLPDDVSEITLFNTIPSEEIESGTIRYGGKNQYIEIYIDGVLRSKSSTYTDSSTEFSIVSDDFIRLVELDSNDYGKEIKVVVRVPESYTRYLRIVSAIEIGNRETFSHVHYRFNITNTISFVLNIVLSITLIAACLFLKIFKFELRSLLYFSIYLFIFCFYLLSDNYVLADLIGYSNQLFIFMCVFSKTFSSILPFFSILLLAYLSKIKLNRSEKVVFITYVFFIILNLILSILSMYYYSILSKYVVTTINCIMMIFFLVKGIIKFHTIEEKLFVSATFSIGFGLILDSFFDIFCPYLSGFYPAFWIFTRLSSSFFLSIGFLFAFVFAELGVFSTVSSRLVEQKKITEISGLKITHFEEQYKTILQSIEGVKILRHDMKHHLHSIYQMNLDGRKEDMKNYITSLLDDSSLAEYRIFCENFTINTLIGYYYKMFEKLDLLFVCNIVVPETIFIDKRNITGLLGNLLSNALEACKKVNDNKPYVDIDMKYDQSMLKINIKNSYNGKINIKDKKIVTTKDSDLHGFGLISVKKIVEHYNGYMRISYDDQTFEIGIILNNGI